MPASPIPSIGSTSLLARFETLNTEIVKGTRIGADVTDYLDQRDALLASIAEEVGIRTVTRDNDDMAIFTDSGVTLFDAKPRTVSFDRTLLYSRDLDGQRRLCRWRADYRQQRSDAGGIGAAGRA